jgi:hypothetical protein
MNRTAQLVCAWAGPIMCFVWVVSFIALAGFIPPPSPLRGPDATLQMFHDHALAIRLGLILTLFASALLVPWCAVIAVQMSRIEGRRPVLAIVQLASGSLLSLEFIVPLMVWQTAAYRPTRERIQFVYMLNDMGWLMFVAVISSAILEILAFGAVILMDTRAHPLFPRWSGYFTLWAALLLAPAGIVPLFKDGPFAWNGLFGFYIPLFVFCSWVLTMTWLLCKTINRDVAEVDEPEIPAPVMTSGAG